MNDLHLFFMKFLRHGTKIASLAPSSPWLSRLTVRGVDWERARTVVELGAGTGPITKAIVERARPGCRLLIMERDPDFARLLRERFSGREGLTVIEGDACDLEAILAREGASQADAIISGLPIPSFSQADQVRLFQAVHRVLAPDGSFNQITEMPWVYLRLYRKYFDRVRFVFEPRNFPPGGAYFCRSPKAAALG